MKAQLHRRICRSRKIARVGGWENDKVWTNVDVIFSWDRCSCLRGVPDRLAQLSAVD